MTLETARQVAAHVTVAFAFLSMTPGGDISPPLVALFGLLWLASLVWGERIRRVPAGVLTAAAGLCLVVLVGLVTLGLVDLVIAASLFAAVLAANRLWARRTAADDGLLYLSALMMLAGGAALSAELAYGLFFAGFAVSVTVALTLSHLARACGEAGVSRAVRDRLVGRRLLVGLTALSLSGLFGAAVVFLFFPRVTARVLARVRVQNRPQQVGFSDDLRLGGHGVLKADARVMIRYRVKPDPKEAALDLLWKGRTFDVYDGRGWVSTAGPVRVSQRFELAPGAIPGVAFDVEVLPAAGTSAVFLPSTAAVVEGLRRFPPNPAAPRLMLASDELGDLRVQPAQDEGYGYTVRIARPPSDSALRGLGRDYPEAVRERFLGLPPDLDPRIRELARSWNADAGDPFEVARTTAGRLAADYGYTTELPGPVADPLADFLFARRKGHCEYFSTAMAVLLRASGIPARNATGYAGGVRLASEGYYIVRGGDAHSWTEVYFPGVGWTPFDPTPAEGRLAQPSPLAAWLAETVERAESRWRSLVVEYGLFDQVRAVRRAFAAVGDAVDRLRGRGGTGAGDVLRPALALLILGAGALAARALWPRPKASRRPVPPSAVEAVVLYRLLLGRLARRGLVKPPAQTPRQFAVALARSARPEADAVRTLTERLLAARFGGRPLGRAEAQRLRREAQQI